MSDKKNLLVISVNRSDYGIWRSVLRSLASRDCYETTLLVTGTHLSAKFGETKSEVHHEGLADKIVELPISSFDMDDIAQPSLQAASFADLLTKHLQRTPSYDLALLLGDRYEVLAAAMVCSIMKLPIVHFHGGAITTGALDDLFRHAITKLSHYHMVETPYHRDRVFQMGESADNIIITGAPSLAGVKNFEANTRHEFLDSIGIDSDMPFYLVTVHSETTKDKNYNLALIKTILAALQAMPRRVLITSPNPDVFYSEILGVINEYVENYPTKFVFIKSLGHKRYFDALTHCHAVVGNSSSGIIEARSFGKFSLDVGDRQKGRDRDDSVFQSKVEYQEIHRNLVMIDQLLAGEQGLDRASIYYNGDSGEIFCNHLDTISWGYQWKKFVSLKGEL